MKTAFTLLLLLLVACTPDFSDFAEIKVGDAYGRVIQRVGSPDRAYPRDDCPGLYLVKWKRGNDAVFMWIADERVAHIQLPD